MKILVTGATGLIGSALVSRLAHAGHEATPISRASTRPSQAFWNPREERIFFGPQAHFDAVVHLAGENIAQRWSEKTKQRIRESRIGTTQSLVQSVTHLSAAPAALLCASATGYYGDRGEELLSEESGSGQGFLAEVCREWEAATTPAKKAGIRVANLRFGVVLSARGGALRKMVPIFRKGLGGKIGNGKQFWSWITLDDALSAIEFLLTHPVISGPVNIVSPNPVRNEEFTRALSAELRRPAFFGVPRMAVKLAMGEMGKEALLSSIRVKPARLEQAGFSFKYPELRQALQKELRAT